MQTVRMSSRGYIGIYRKGIRMKKDCFEIPANAKAGIYMLFNINNRKAYIGETNNFQRRAIQHSSQLLNNAHSNKKVQNDFNNGMEFCFVILEEVGENCTKEELRILELQYIFTFRSKFMELYNLETIEQAKDLLFQDMIMQKRDRIQKNFHDNFGCPMPMLKHCGINKVKEKFLSCV